MKAESRNEKSEIERRITGVLVRVAVMLGAALVAVGGLSGCSTLDRAYKQQVTWTNAPVVGVVTNTVVVTNVVPLVLERTNVVFVTNAVSGAVAGDAVREPVATNMVEQVSDNPAARLTAQEISERLRQAEERSAGQKTAAAA